jgi:hypothetical protein
MIWCYTFRGHRFILPHRLLLHHSSNTYPKDASVHPVLMAETPKPLYFSINDYWMNRCIHRVHHRFIWQSSSQSLHSLYSSGATRKPTINSSDGTCWSSLHFSLPYPPTLALLLLHKYWWCPFLHFSFLLYVSFDWDFIHGTYNATKTCSAIMVSSIDHVVMNHQNHTRTNDLMYGHVGYNDYQRNQHVACPQQQCDTMWAQRTKL